MRKVLKALPTLLVWVALVVVFLLVWKFAFPESDTYEEPHGVFLADLEEGEVGHVLIVGDQMTVFLRDGTHYRTPFGTDVGLVQRMENRGISVSFEAPEDQSLLEEPWFWLLGAVVFFVVVFVILFRRMKGASTNILTLRKSRARLLPDETKVRFSDVGGAQEVKDDLQDVIDYLTDPASWKKAGIRLPHGVLLEGPPGCGKTLIARAVAGEAKAPFFIVSASEFVEMFVGVGAARVRDMFETASKKAPCIVFIDELDAVGRRRGSGVGSAHDEREQTLNQLLVCMDGFETDDRVVVIAATNRPDVLDKALLRPGRLDRILRIPLPDRDTRVEILRVHTRNKKLAPDVSLETLADRMDSANGSALEALANEAALLAMRRVRRSGGESWVGMADFEKAISKGKRHERIFDQLDQILVESASQLAQPVGKTIVRVTLRGGEVVEGELVWADGAFLKVCPADRDRGVIVPKMQVGKLESLSGTGAVQEIVADPWAHGRSELA